VDNVLAGVCDGNGAESIEADVESGIETFDSPRSEVMEKLGGEMKAGSRRGGTTGFTGINRLITFRVAELFMNVRGKRHFTDRKEPLFIIKADSTDAFIRGGDDFSLDFRRNVYQRAGLKPFSRFDQSFPGTFRQFFEKEDFNFAAALIPCTMETGRDYPAIVENENVTFVEVIDEVMKMTMLEMPGAAVEYHEARMVTGLDGMLGDEPGGEMIIEIAGFHIVYMQL
jgi:hypothetical protein